MINASEIKMTIRRDKQTGELYFETLPQVWSSSSNYDGPDELGDYEALERKHRDDVWVYFDADYKGRKAWAHFDVPRSLVGSKSPDVIEAAIKERALAKFIELFGEGGASNR